MASAMMTRIGAPPTDGVDNVSGFDREPGTIPLSNQLSIQQLVAHLSDSAQKVQERIGAAHSLDKSSVQQPEPPIAESQPSQKPAQATVNPETFGLHDTFGAAMTTALSQAVSAGRFNAVRDSLTGDQFDTLMQPPQRPLAEARNVFTKEEMAALDKSVSPYDALSTIEDPEAIPQGFRRLNSPRSYKQTPDAFQKALKAQVECLPMLYADQLQGHIVDMRSLLGPGVWDRVQQAVDWTDWTDEEKLAALNRVLVARDRDSVMNAAELQEARDKPQSLQLPSRAQPQPKRQRSDDSDFTVVANSNGISVKHPDQQPPRQLTEEEAIELMQAMRGSVQMATDKGSASNAQRVKQMLEGVPTVTHPVPSETNPPRFAAPSDSFWQDIEAQVLESLRQAERAPRIADLVCSTEEAIFLHSKQRHYAQLASRLFAATHLQAAWRCFSMRKWYKNYKKTAEFTQRQQEYEQHMREKWAEEEAAERARVKARLSKTGKDGERLSKHDWNQKSRYMQNAVRSAAKSMQGATARESLGSFKRREQGLMFLEEGKSHGKRPSELSVGQSGITGRGAQGPRANTQKLSGNLLTAKAAGSDSLSPPPALNRNLTRSISDGSIQSHSSMGNTSHTSGMRDTRQRAGRPEDTRSGWLSQAAGISDEPEVKAIDESMSTGRLRERKKKRQQRKEAAMQLAQMPPEARAAARSEEERISRRIAVMEQVLGPENAGHFEQGMHAPAASSSSPEGRAACNVLPTISESPAPSAQGESSDVLSVAGWSHRTPTRPASSGSLLQAPSNESVDPVDPSTCVATLQALKKDRSMENVHLSDSDVNDGITKADPDKAGQSMVDTFASQASGVMEHGGSVAALDSESPSDMDHGTAHDSMNQELSNGASSSTAAPEAVHVPNTVPVEEHIHESGAPCNTGDFLSTHDSFEWTSTPSCTALHAADGGGMEHSFRDLTPVSQAEVLEVPSTPNSEVQSFWRVSHENCVPEGGPATMNVAAFSPGEVSHQDKDTSVHDVPVSECQNNAENRVASARSTRSEGSSMHEWTNRMVPALGEPLERDSLNMSVRELTLARLPESGNIQKATDRCTSAQSSASFASKDIAISCADGDSCIWSARTGAPWQAPEETSFQLNRRSSPGNSHSHSQGGRLMLSHDGTCSSAPGTDGIYGYQLQVQGSGIDLMQGSQTCSAKEDVRHTTSEDGKAVHKDPSGTYEEAPSRTRNSGVAASASPAEVALHYVQQQLETRASTSASQGQDEWLPARSFSLTPPAASIASFGSCQPVPNEAGISMHRLQSSNSVQRSSSFLPSIHRGSAQGTSMPPNHIAPDAEAPLMSAASGIGPNGGFLLNPGLSLAGNGQNSTLEQQLHPVEHLGTGGLPRLGSRPVTEQGVFPGGVHGSFAVQPEKHGAGGREVHVTNEANTQGVPLSGTLSDINRAIQKLRQGEVKGVDDVLGRVLRKDSAGVE